MTDLRQSAGTPTSVEDLQARLKADHEQLSPRLREVSRYVLDNPHSVAFDTIAVIAEAAGVHGSTLVRFGNSLGFSGFSEVQKLFKRRVMEQTGDYSERIRALQSEHGGNLDVQGPSLMQEFIQTNALSLEQLRGSVSDEQLKQAISWMAQAKEIYVTGVRRAYPAVAYFNYALTHSGVRCMPIDYTGGMQREQCAHMGERDVLIAITFYPYAEETRELISEAHKRGALVIVISDSTLIPKAQHANLIFAIKDAEVRGFRSLNSTLCLAQTLCIGLAFKLENEAE